MPGLLPEDMNGDFDRRPVPSFMNGTDPYKTEYYRDDPRYRSEENGEDLYRAVAKNGRYGDHGGFENRGNDPTYELDHLATFRPNEPNATLQAADGLRKLRYMENNTGIWTMRCVMVIERKFLVIIDYSTGEELERFPISMIQEPTAIFKNDKREIYNNLILFSVKEDFKTRNAPSDMHIFQSISCAAQEIVDEILAAKEGRPRNQVQRISTASIEVERPRPIQDYRVREPSVFIGGGPPRTLVTRTIVNEYDPGQNEVLERDVQLLNHCFDDIEKFVARLQQAAEAYKELEKRKNERKGKKKQSGEGMLSSRARPPPSSDFVDIFQKFKLSFNLLAKLKAHIHDPNAPELVHFLFTPLSLIYEASRDPIHGGQNLADLALAPVLTLDAKQLLLHCLTSKEQDMWQNLGRNWTTARDEWKGHIPQYVPRFYDGWQPSPGLVEEEVMARSRSYITPVDMHSRSSPVVGDIPIIRPIPQDDFEDVRRSYELRPNPRPPSPIHRPPVVANPVYDIHPISGRDMRDSRDSPVSGSSSKPRNRQEENQAFMQKLRSKGASIYEVLHERLGKNPKELSVQKGDILEVVDNNRNWWKVRNYKEEEGFVPYTILKEVVIEKTRDRSSGVYTTQITSIEQNSHSLAVPKPPPPAPSPTDRSRRRGDFKYF